MPADWNQAVDAHTDLIASHESAHGRRYLENFCRSIASKAYRHDGTLHTPEEDLDYARHILQGILASVPGATPIWVDEDVVELVNSAATHPTFEPTPIFPDDLICDSGFVYAQRPFHIPDSNSRDLAFRAFCWSKVWVSNMHKEALLLSFYTHRGDKDDFYEDSTGERFPRIAGSDLSIAHMTIVYFGAREWLDANFKGNRELASQIEAFWRLAKQEIVIPGMRGIDRATRRRRMKRFKEVKDVVVYTLRRQRQLRRDEGEGQGVEWSHRWMVSGHWRNQPYKIDGQVVTRQIYIEQYVKGPDDKPLIVKQRVFDFRR